MPETLSQLMERVGKEALERLHGRGVQINAFLLGRHHQYLRTALQSVFTHDIPLGAAEGALRVAYWREMNEFLRRSPVPKVMPLEWSGPLKDAVNILVVGVFGNAPENLLVRPESLIDDVRRILHATMLRSRFDLICFPRMPRIDVPESTANFLRSLATEYRLVIQIGFFDAAGNAGDHTVLYAPIVKPRTDVLQHKLFAEPTSAGRGGLTIQQLIVAPTHIGNICTLIGDDVEHESVRDLICRQNREGDGVDLILNVATDVELESPASLSRLCMDADAYGLWIQRGKCPVLCTPASLDRFAHSLPSPAVSLPGVSLSSFTIELAPLRRMRRARADQDAAPTRGSQRVPPPTGGTTPAVETSNDAPRGGDEGGATATVSPAPVTPGGGGSVPMPELRTYLDQSARALAALRASVTALHDTSRASGASAESIATALGSVAEQLARLHAHPSDDGSVGRAAIQMLTELATGLRAELAAARAFLEREAGGGRLAQIDESLRKLPDTITATFSKQPPVAAPAPSSETKSATNETSLLMERVGRIDRTLEQLTTLLTKADSQDTAAVHAQMKTLGSS